MEQKRRRRSLRLTSPRRAAALMPVLCVISVLQNLKHCLGFPPTCEGAFATAWIASQEPDSELLERAQQRFSRAPRLADMVQPSRAKLRSCNSHFAPDLWQRLEAG